jgi:hypothetical protein
VETVEEGGGEVEQRDVRDEGGEGRGERGGERAPCAWEWDARNGEGGGKSNVSHLMRWRGRESIGEV